MPEILQREAELSDDDASDDGFAVHPDLEEYVCLFDSFDDLQRRSRGNALYKGATSSTRQRRLSSCSPGDSYGSFPLQFSSV